MQECAVQAKKVEGVVDADRGTEDGECPAKLEAGGAVDEAVSGLD